MERANGDPFNNDILIEILLRLSLINLYACKSVSKRWYQIISSPYFRQRYQFQRREQNVSLSALLGFFQSGEHGSFRRTTRPLSNSWDVPFEYHLSKAIASSNGLLLYYTPYCMTYLVCNPITGEWLHLPYPLKYPWDSLDNAVGFDVERLSHRDYRLENFKFKVVCIMLLSSTCDSKDLKLEIYSSENKEWMKRTLISSIGTISLRPSELAVVINGVYYWWERSNRVVAYDSSSQEGEYDAVQVVELPKRNISTIERSFVLGKSNDGLLQYGSSDSFEIVVWVMDGIGEHKWSMRHTVSFMFMHHMYPDIMSSCDLVSRLEAPPRSERDDIANVPELLAFHPRNSRVVFLRLDKRIICCCLDSGSLKKVELHGDFFMFGERRLNMERCKRLVPYFLPTWASFSSNPLFSSFGFQIQTHHTPPLPPLPPPPPPPPLPPPPPTSTTTATSPSHLHQDYHHCHLPLPPPRPPSLPPPPPPLHPLSSGVKALPNLPPH